MKGVLRKKNRCTACDGIGITKRYFIGTVKVYPPEEIKCHFCNGTGKRKEQIFNWMQEEETKKPLRLIRVNGPIRVLYANK
jgi:DnaJ-class molecular chaperone